MTPANTSYSGSPPAASRTDEEDHGERSKEDIIHVSSDAYSKRNDDATASSSTTDHVATSSTTLLLDSSTNMNATVARARPTNSSSPTRSTPPSCSSPRKPLLSTTQTHDFYGRGGLGHHASSFRRHEHEQDLPGEKYRLRQQGVITSCDTKNDEERPGSSEALFLRFAGEQREKSTEKFPSLDAGISEPYHAIDARTFSGSDLYSNSNVQLPHKPSHPFHSQSSSNISESSRDIGKASKEQVKEAIIEKMNAYFESKYNTQVSNKFPQKVREILQFVLFILSFFRVLDSRLFSLESYFILLILGSIHI